MKKSRDKEIEKGTEAWTAGTDGEEGTQVEGKGQVQRRNHEERGPNIRGGWKAQTHRELGRGGGAGMESQGAWGQDRQTGRQDRPGGSETPPGSKRRTESLASLVGGEAGRGSRGGACGASEAGGQAPGPRGSEQRPFPTWGPNLVLHTQGTEGDYRQTTQQPPPLPPTPSLHPALTLSHPGAKRRELC